MKHDVSQMPHLHRRCVMGMDEMAIQEAEVYDASVKKMIGQTTFWPHIGLAKKALVVAVAGITRRFKFTVAYFLTSNRGKDEAKRKLYKEENTVGHAFKDLVFEALRATETIGLLVDVFVLDMGPDNQALLRALGLGFSKNDGVVRCSIPHPCRPNDTLWFLPDTVHIFKNIPAMLTSNQFITLSPDIVKEEALQSSLVKLEHLQDLVNFENNFELKVAFRLKQDKLDCKKTYARMKVGNTCAVYCRRTEAALKAKAAATGDQANDATAFFVGLVAQWFQIVTNRGRKLALRKDNADAYQSTLETIRKTSRVFRTMKVGKDGRWKCVQSAMVMACEVLLQVQDFYLDVVGLVFVLLGRLTQDFIENIFSLIRFRLAIPNALHFKHNLRIITLAQICLTSKNTSYFWDTNEDVLLPTDFITVKANRNSGVKNSR